MSHPVLWPKTYFYPIGNSTALCLTRYLPPEKAASVVLLGCGDPRNILYTLHTDTRRAPFDFTCCDHEPGIIARNVLLFTLIQDGHQSDRLWNIFYHIRLDESSFCLLISQSKKLLQHTADLATWQKSSYSRILQLCTSYTLSQLRRYLELYAHAEGFSAAKHRHLFSSFTREFAARHASGDKILDPARSAGPFLDDVSQILKNHFSHYWTTGIVSRSRNDIAAATAINPTFVYSEAFATCLVGDHCTFHYDSHPLQGFHLASAFLAAPLAEGITEEQLLSSAQAEFQEWCHSFKTVASSHQTVTIRLLAGDALAFCRVLSQFRNISPDRLYVAPWNAEDLLLDGPDYEGAWCAPTKFNVIDASNVPDHVGLLNILIVAVPLLVHDSASILSTEIRLQKRGGSASLIQRLCTDIPAIGLLLGVSPADASTQFTSNCEIMHLVPGSEHTPYRERIIWKFPYPMSPSSVNKAVEIITPSFPDASDLATVLFSMYTQMFAEEDGTKSLEERAQVKMHHNRGTFAALLELVKTRVQADWTAVMEKIFVLLHTDQRIVTGLVNYQDLCCQLHLRGVFSVPTVDSRCRINAPIDTRTGVFKGWTDVPGVVCLVLLVPRKSIKILEEKSAAEELLGSPLFRCRVGDGTYENYFSSIQVALGSISTRGSGQKCEVTFTEDPAGWSGRSALVVSVLIPAFILVYNKKPEATRISLCLYPTPGAIISLSGALGQDLSIFSANVMDKTAVHVTMNRPNRSTLALVSKPPAPALPSCKRVSVDISGLQMGTMKARWEVTPTELAKCTVECEQISPCIIQVVLDGGALRKNLVFPFPADGARAKTRIARASGWIEIVTPVHRWTQSTPADLTNTVILDQERCPIVWNIHRVNPTSLPAVKLSEGTRRFHTFLNAIQTYASSCVFYDREAASSNQEDRSIVVGVKHTIRQLFEAFAGKTVRIVEFKSKAGISETVLYINGLRMDLASHTFIMDVCVLPLTQIGRQSWELLRPGCVETISMRDDEVKGWKHLLVAFTERCRSWAHKPTCEYSTSGKIPLSVELFQNPLCGCGEGIQLGDLSVDMDWKDLAPFMTRAMISPLYALSYLGTVVKSHTSWIKSCAACHKTEKPTLKLLKCSVCNNVNYCGKDCQRSHWKEHKKACKTKK